MDCLQRSWSGTGGSRPNGNFNADRYRYFQWQDRNQRSDSNQDFCWPIHDAFCEDDNIRLFTDNRDEGRSMYKIVNHPPSIDVAEYRCGSFESRVVKFDAIECMNDALEL